MLSPEEISRLQERLAAHRTTLDTYLYQRAAQGKANERPEIAAGISEARHAIARLKVALRAAGVPVADQIDDDDSVPAPQTPPDAPAAPADAPPAPAADGPFIVGPPVPPERFYGRIDQRRRLAQCLWGPGPRSVVLLGYYRSGKTSLLHYLLDRPQEFFAPDQRPLLVALNFSAQSCATPQDVTAALRRGVADRLSHPPWPAEGDRDPHQVEEGLHRLRAAGWRLVVLIDEFQKIAERGPSFKDWGGDWRAHGQSQLLSMVIASALPIADVYQAMGGTSPFGNDFATAEPLGPLEQPAAYALLQAGFAAAGRPLGPAELLLADELSGGMPFYLQLAGELLLREPDFASARYAFADEAEPHLRALWLSLQERERVLLRQAVAGGRIDPSHAYRLRKRGLLRSDNQPFSSALAELIERGEL